MKEYIAICEINYYDTIEEADAKETVVFTCVDNYTEAMQMVEEYYGSDLNSARITLLEGPALVVGPNTADKILRDELD